MRALPMDQPRIQARGRDDFMVSPSNSAAVALLDAWPDWPDGRLALIGPEGAGKTHLACAWAAASGARALAAADLRAEKVLDLAADPVLIEDADRGVDEDALFHLWNACAAAGQGLLLTGRRRPASWPVTLPDLRSRLASLTPAVIDGPDDTLLSALLLKLFADRQLRVKPELIAYLLPRMERSFRAAARMVERLDRASLDRGVPLNRTLARDLLGG